MNLTTSATAARPRHVADVVVGKLDRARAADTYLRWEPWFAPTGAGVAYPTLDAAVAAAQLASREGTPRMHTRNATLGVYEQDAAFGIAYLARSDWSGTAEGVHANLGSDRERSFTTYEPSLRALVNAERTVLLGAPGTSTPLSTH